MLPKIIHYCWFGRGEKSRLAKKCIASWKKYCPDYKIVEWNEDNFDVNMNGYTKWCYENKKYAFLSDFVRLWVVYRYGGMYFDVDVEIVQSLEELVKGQAFFGFETKERINTGLGFGAEAGHEIVGQMIAEYDFLLDGNQGVVGCTVLNTKALVKYGLIQNGKYQILPKAIVYPISSFNPYDDATGRLNKTKKTYSIHWYAKSWMSKKQIIRSTISKPLHRLYEINFFKHIRK